MDLLPLLSNLLDSNPNTRKDAESSLLSSSSNPSFFPCLSSILSQNNNELKSLAAVLLRRFAKSTSYSSIPLNFKLDSHSHLLTALISESDHSTRHKIADAAAEMLKSDLANNVEWQLLQSFLFDSLANKSSVNDMNSAVRILATVPHLLTANIPQSCLLLSNALLSNDEDLSVATIHCATEFIASVLEENDKKTSVFNDLMIAILKCASSFNDEYNVVESFTFLIELADVAPKLFRPLLHDLISFIVTCGNNESLESAMRQTTMELLLALAEANPGMIRKTPIFASSVVPCLLSWMSKIEDDEDWYTTEDLSNDDEDNDQDYIFAEQAIDRLSLALGGKTMLSIAFDLIPKLLSSPNWQNRHAGLLSISVLGEGCRSLMIDSLGDVVNLVVPYLRDPHPRVRFAACNCIGQMCTDFGPTVQQDYNDVILSGLVPLLDEQVPRVQAHSAAALVNFMEDADKHKVTPVLDEIVGRLVNLLNSTKTYVQEQAITTIATVADCSESGFAKYYPTIMPLLINILQNATDKKFRLMRGKALECATLIGLAVGKDVFAQHVDIVLSILQHLQQSPREDDDPISSYLLVAWARVCKVIGVAFVPYLSVVIPPLLASAAQKPETTFLESDESTENYPEEEGWEFVPYGDQQFGIKTTVLEDKHTALEMICTYARDLEQNFSPFVDQVFATTVPLLDFIFDEEVRHSAANTIPLLFNCMVKANASVDQILVYWNEICKKLMMFMTSDMDPKFAACIYSVYATCLGYLGKDYLSSEQMKNVADSVGVQLDAFIARCLERDEKRKDDDYDPEEEENLLADSENDSELLSELANCIHEIFKISGPGFTPFFTPLLSKLKLFIAHTTDEIRHFGICVFGDVIEYTGAYAWETHEFYLSELTRSLSSSDPDVRQAAAYCIGIAVSASPEFYPFCVKSLADLGQMILAPKSRTNDNIMATENAISAVGKICAAVDGVSGFNATETLIHWINAMPILNDLEEANVSYKYLLKLISQSHVGLLSANEKTGVILSVLCKALVSDLVLQGEIEREMIAVVKRLGYGVDLSCHVAAERIPVLVQKLR